MNLDDLGEPLVVSTLSGTTHTMWFATEADRHQFVSDVARHGNSIISADGYDLLNDPDEYFQLDVDGNLWADDNGNTSWPEEDLAALVEQIRSQGFRNIVVRKEPS